MTSPPFRFTLRQSLVAVAVLAVILAAARAVQARLGPRDGGYTGIYRYLGSDGKWQVVRGNAIFVKDGMIFVD